MRRAVRHQENGVLRAAHRQLCFDRLDKLGHIVRLILLPHPVHERRSQRHLLELVLIEIEHRRIIGVLHAGEKIQRRNGNARVTFLFKFFQRLLRRRNLQALFRFNAVDDNVRRKGQYNLCIRMRRLDGLHRRLDRLGARLLKRRAEAHDKDRILIFQILQFRCFVLQNADLRRHFKRRSSVFDLRVQLIPHRARRSRKAQERRAGQRGRQKILPIFFHSPLSFEKIKIWRKRHENAGLNLSAKPRGNAS